MRLRAAVLFVATVVSGVPLQAQDQFFDSNGVRIRYVDRGSGTPIVLVHGILGSIENNWVETGVLGNLSRDHRVIAFDMRGCGKSDKPHDPAKYGGEMAADIVRLMDHLKLQTAHVVGYSLGAFVVGLAVTKYPERFVTATLGGDTPYMGAWTKANLERTEAAAQEYEQGNLRSLMVGSAPKDRPPSDEEIRQRSEVALKGQDRLAIAAVRRSYREFLISEEAFKVARLPLMSIIGSDDPSVPDVQAAAKLKPDMKVVIIQGATHNAPRNARARPEFVAAIREFVKAHPIH